MTHEMPTICPHCCQHHEAATHMGGADFEPDDGDVTICLGCGRLCIFDSESYGGLRKPTKKEQRTIDRNERVREVVTAWKVVRRQ
jgi:hypothetical protein